MYQSIINTCLAVGDWMTGLVCMNHVGTRGVYPSSSSAFSLGLSRRSSAATVVVRWSGSVAPMIGAETAEFLVIRSK
jgi:hypothetical protein